jgi:hypothetical protein
MTDGPESLRDKRLNVAKTGGASGTLNTDDVVETRGVPAPVSSS